VRKPKSTPKAAPKTIGKQRKARKEIKTLPAQLSRLPQQKHITEYEILAQDESQADSEGKSHPLPQQNNKPPPIFIHGVINYNQLIKSICEVAEDEQYFTKSMANNVTKLTCSTPDTYRNIVKHFKENAIFFHTYQLKEETANRVVLKYLHHSTDVQNIRQELLEMGHVNRNIVNAHHRQIKEPLNHFFVDLKPADNNKDIYNITAIQNKIINIEHPQVNKKHIPQCVRCQQYGLTRSYCNKPYACVKCGGPHSSTDCTKQTDTPAKCALCGGNHPAKYKGCEHYHNIIGGYNRHRTRPQ
jgi:peptidyl-tRNA hydrolase